MIPGITYTMGGIAIDEHAQVLDLKGVAIPGLFAAGATTGGLEGGENAVYIGGLIKAGVFGLLAAERMLALRKHSGKSIPAQPPEQQSRSATPERPRGLARAAGQRCDRCGRPITPTQDTRRRASGTWVHEACPT